MNVVPKHTLRVGLREPALRSRCGLVGVAP